jgi:gliding motility-associated-like protein
LSGNQSYYSNSQALFGTSISGSITSSQTVWIYDADGACTDEESFVVTVNATPTFSLSSSSPTTCNGTNGTITITGLNPNTSYSVNYSDNGNPVSNTLNSDGSGVILITGQDAGTYNNFSVTLNGCSGTNPGILTLSNPNAPVIDDIADQTVCDSYVLPTITGSNLTSSASYWTAPLGTGSQLTAGNALTTTQTVYIYDANGLCTSEQSFTITIDYTPIINNPGPQLACDTYTLPVITGSALPGSQAYFDDSQLNGGTSISGNLSASQTVWVFAADGACSDEVSFTVTINYTPVLNNPGNQVVCDTYSLPVITGTNLSGNELYYDNSQANNGSDITGPITSDQTIWIFDFDGQCSDEESFTLTINQTPFIDDVPDQIVCDSYSLTPITGSNLSGSQSYYNNSQALGGTVLTGNILSSQTVWIYDAEGSCSDEESFNITVNNTPVVDDVPDVVVCDNFSLPTITGTSLSGTQAFYNDSQINGGTVISGSITSSQTIWIYDSEGSCSDEESFEITVNETPSLSDPGDQIACDTYTLPLVQGTNLTPNAAYYTNTPALGGTVLNGTINSSQTIWIFDADGLCADSTSFMVTINETPQLQINNPEPVCEPVTIDLTAPEITAGSSSATSLSYWTDAGATSSLSNPSAIAASGTYYISADNDGCSDIASVVATINPIPPAPLAGTNATYCSVWAIEPLNVSGSGGTFTWYDANGTVLGTGTTFTPENTIGTTTYSVTETLIGCEGPPSVVSITINLCEIYIPTAFTPTGNGVNDTWEIVDIDQVYPLNVVMIYSRWGNLLFKHDSSTDGPYDQHRWDGTYEGSAMPVGSYYFIIETGLENEEAITGTVSIIKK